MEQPLFRFVLLRNLIISKKSGLFHFFCGFPAFYAGMYIIEGDIMGKSLVLSVKVGTGCYRHIQLPEVATLFTLHEAILDAFDFIDDHMHAFFMNNRAWDEDGEYICPGGDRALGFTDKVKLSKFHLGKGDKFLYVFDFGDDWRFQIKVLNVTDEIINEPIILKSVGEVYQYGFDEDDDDF